MLRKLLGNIFIQAFRALFVGVFVALNLVGAVFLAVIGYYLIF